MSFLLTGTLESLAGISSLARDASRGKPLPWSMEARARFRTYARRIGWGYPLPKSLEQNAGRNPRPTHAVQL
jgi:hypothetical protein